MKTEDIEKLWNKFKGKYLVIFNHDDFVKFMKESIPQPGQLTEDKVTKIIDELHIYFNKKAIGDITVNVKKVKELAIKAICNLTPLPSVSEDIKQYLIYFAEYLNEAISEMGAMTLPSIKNAVTVWLQSDTGKALQSHPQETVIEEIDRGHGKCMANPQVCKRWATKDYNGHGYWVCDIHNEILNDEFDEEYR